MTPKPLSIAIETSARQGSAAIGLGDEMIAETSFDASSRHASQLLGYLDRLLGEAAYSPADINQVYVSAGPGSFTGLRIGITVARTLGHMIPQLQCVSVPTSQAVALNACDLDFENLAVVLASKETRAWLALFGKTDGQIVETHPGKLVEFEEFLASAPRPLTLIGEAVGYFQPEGEGISTANEELFTPLLYLIVIERLEYCPASCKCCTAT